MIVDHPEPAFKVSTAWLAAGPACFLVLAELPDTYIATKAVRDWDPLWDLGDVFEVFMKPSWGHAYFETQFAPNGCLLHLRYPKVGARRDRGIRQYIQLDHSIRAAVRIEPQAERWLVAAALPMEPMLAHGPARLPDNWRVAFCRYDYDAAGGFCLSSSASLSEPSFHRVDEWTRVTVAPP